MAPPRRLAGYELVASIATGGMATVFLARKSGVGGFQREVALKLMHAHLREQDGFVRDVVEEAKLTARIRHPNVAQVLDVGDDPAGVYIVMEYVEGDTLSGLVRALGGEQVPLPIASKILADALAGLHAAHELRTEQGTPAELVHRDVSPQNVLVGTDGVTRLIDFGIAKSVDRPGFTKSGIIKGKFGYMSPEQVRGARLDRRADVWSAGVVAWELLAGRRLHEGEEAMIVLRTLSEEPPRLRSIRPDLPEALDAAIASALKIDLAARCPTAEELRLGILAAGAIADGAEVARFVSAVASDAIAERKRRAAEGVLPAVDAARDEDVPRRSPRSRRLASALAIAVGVTGATAVAAVKLRNKPAKVDAAVPSAPADSGPIVVVEPSSSPQSAPAVAADPAPSAPPNGLTDLSVSANAKMVRVVAKGTTVPIAPASTAAVVRVARDPREDFDVEAVAVDGRVRRQHVAAGARAIEIVFGAIVRPRRAPAAVPVAPEPTKPSLQGNPYRE
jgi:eukaryotic-like serine/threonine-protein kinase